MLFLRPRCRRLPLWTGTPVCAFGDYAELIVKSDLNQDETYTYTDVPLSRYELWSIQEDGNLCECQMFAEFRDCV